MKMCNDCNLKMIECKNSLVRSNLEASRIGEKDLDIIFHNYNTKAILTPWDYVKARVCPKCGKLELYVDPKKAKLDEIIIE